MVEWCKTLIRSVYNNYPDIRKTIDMLSYGILYMESVYFNHRIEPIENDWISASVLKNQWNENVFSESFTKILLDGSYSDHVIGTTFDDYCKTAQNTIKTTPSISEIMTTLKYNNQYITYSCFPDKTDKAKLIRFPIQPSKVSFLSIEYVHPAMSQKIVMDIHNDYYMSNNHLLTPLFVKRFLEYQSQSYYFDMDYELNLMDSDLNLFSLNSKQYILLNNEGYTIETTTETR